MNDHVQKSVKQQMIWLLCFSCKRRNREPRAGEDNTDNYEHHAEGNSKGVNEELQNGAGKNKETREKIALRYLKKQLVNFTNPIRTRIENEDDELINEEEMLQIMEEGIKELTPIVKDKEIFNLTNVGRIQMSKGVQDFNNIHLLVNKRTVIALVEFQPDVVAAFRPNGGNLSISGIVSVTMFGRDKETREKIALSYLEKKLDIFNPISTRFGNEDDEPLKAEQMLEITEEGIKELTPIVKDKEIFTFNLTNVGRIQMSKGVQDFNDNVHLLANKSTVIAVVEFQPDVSAALMPIGGNFSISRIVSVTMFDDTHSSSEGHTKLREPVSIKFGHGSQIASHDWSTFPPSAFSVKCVYWNFTTSNWSTDGCLARWVSL